MILTCLGRVPLFSATLVYLVLWLRWGFLYDDICLLASKVGCRRVCMPGVCLPRRIFVFSPFLPPTSTYPDFSGRTGLVKRKLRNNYHRLISSRKGARKGSNTDGFNKATRALAAKVWKDVNRTMSPRRHGTRPGLFSGSQLGGGGHVCPAYFAGGSKHAVFRCVRMLVASKTD